MIEKIIEFFRKRRFLKNCNTLDLIPVRRVLYQVDDNGKIDLKVPKFGNEKFARWFIPAWKSLEHTVHLDETGSEIWMLMDGEKNVDEICKRMENKIKGDTIPRITRFITQLYESGYISFIQLLEKKL